MIPYLTELNQAMAACFFLDNFMLILTNQRLLQSNQSTNQVTQITDYRDVTFIEMKQT